MDGDLILVTWEAKAFYAGGSRPSPEMEKAARKESTGVAVIDIKTGELDLLDDADLIADAKLLPMPSLVVETKFGELQLRIVDGQPTKNPLKNRRTLQALNEAKEVVWEREIAAPTILPPLP